MNSWITPTELQILVAEKLRGAERERVRLNPARGFRVRELANMLLSLIF